MEMDFIDAIETAKDESIKAVQESFIEIGNKYRNLRDHGESDENSFSLDNEMIDFAIRKVKASDDEV
jgi:hypothetical protein